MSMICPQCQTVYEQQFQCRECGCRLTFHSPGLLGDSLPDRDTPSQWQHSPWGRILIGVLVAQGLSYGLQQLIAAGVAAAGSEADGDVWGTLFGLVLVHGAWAVSLLVGGAITGAGRERGLLYGLVHGLANAAVFLMFRHDVTQDWGNPTTYFQPILQVGAGTVGGLIGMLIWQPTPSLPLLSGPADRAAQPADLGFASLAGPVHPFRVAVGMAVVVAGVLWSQSILDLVLRAGHGTLSVTSHLQTQLVSWEITALVTALGACVAGSSTFNGLKQGLCVGLGSMVVILGFHFANPRMSFDHMLVVGLLVVGLSVVGGWFGGQLFPPVISGKHRRLSTY